MKRCPECRRDYHDDTLLFCLDDGSALLEGPASESDPDIEPATAILAETDSPNEPATRSINRTTEETAVLTPGAGSDDQGSSKHISEAHRSPAHRAAKPLIIAAVAAVVLIGGYFGLGYLRSGGSGPISSIAVLPFENRSSDDDTEYLSDGLAESLIFRLTQLPDLKVSPASSVMRYKGKETDVAKIAAELGVDAVMTGRLTKRGDDLNITVELVDARNNRSLWGEQYKRKMSELLSTQREIAAAIAEKLQVRLTSDPAKGIEKKYTENNDAYQLFLKGRYHFARRTKDDFRKAIGYYRQALELDPDFAVAHVGIADAYNVAPANQVLSGNEALPLAKAAAERALAIDPSLAGAHSALAVSLAFYDRNWAESEREFKKAIELDPNVAEIHYYYGLHLLRPTGRLDEAIREIKRALELEPLSIPFGANLVFTYGAAEQKRQALEVAQKTYSLDPNHPHIIGALGFAYVENEMYSEAIGLFEKTRTGNSNQIDCRSFIGVAYARTGQREKAEETITRCREESKTRFVGHWATALIYVALGERDKAFADLERSLAEGDTDVSLLKVSTWAAPLRGDPRFGDLLKRMNLSE